MYGGYWPIPDIRNRDYWLIECTLLRKADIQPGTPEIESENVRFTLGSGHSANIDQRVR